MSFRIETDLIKLFKPRVEVKPQPPVKPPIAQPADSSKKNENLLAGNLLKFKLQNANSPIAAQYNALPESGGAPLKSIFADGYDGIGPVRANYVSPYAEDARPEEAASFLKYDPAFSNPGSRGEAFANALELHKNDPEWTKNFLREIGKDQVADYISDTFNQPYATYDQIAKNTGTIRNALETMVKTGDLSQKGMDALVGELKETNPNVYTEIFAKSSDPQFKQMFVQATINNGDNHLEAAGAYVLQTLSTDQQAGFLNNLSDSQLNSFVEGAMAGQFQIQDLKSSMENRNYPVGDIPEITIGGIGSLISTASIETGYHGSTFEYAPFSKQLQQRLFIAAGEGLRNGDAFENFKNDKIFKDSLSEIFINNGASILKSQAPDGAFTDSDFIGGLTKTFELTLFTQNPGGLRDDLMQSVVKTMGSVGDASKAPPLAQAEYEKLHNGWSQQDHVEVMGGLQAMVLQAASNQKEYISNNILKDQEQKKELVGFITGMAFSFLPGAGEIFGKMAGEGASFLQQIPDKIVSYTFDQGKSQIESSAQEGLVNLLTSMNKGDSEALKNVDAFISGFKQTIVGTSSVLPNGEAGENGKADELNLRTAFQSAFAFYGDLVRF